MKRDFKVAFNKGRQWINIYLESVSPKTFEKKGGGRWGYFLATWKNPNSGEFGEIHFVKSNISLVTVSHEVFHAVAEHAWISGESINRRNEEFYACMTDEIFGKIEKGLKRII